MLKVFGIAVAAAVAALALGVGIVSNTPSASADATAVRSVSCLLLAGAIDGNPDNATTGADIVTTCDTPLTAAQISTMATAIGDRDSTLEPADLDAIDPLDGNQLRENCTTIPVLPAGPFNTCIVLTFVFVNDEKPVTLDLPSGLASLESGGPTDNICSVNSEPLPFPSNPSADFDCNDVPATDGDGVVLFHVLVAATGGATRGSTATTFVRQEDVQQSFDLHIVGVANNVILTLVETTISTSGNASALSACKTGVDVTDAISPSNATLAYAQVFDQDDRELTMVPIGLGPVPAGLTISPPSEIDTVAGLGVGDPVLDVLGTTSVTVDPTTEGAPIAFYQVVCGGRGTGVTDITAVIDTNLDGVSDDTSTQELTVVGAPASITLTADPAMIACDGTATSIVTAVIADSAGNPVAQNTKVNFSVVALGTANPINTFTLNGIATSVITPLSNASAGVTVIVTAGDSAISTVVQASTRVDCALPIATGPTAVPTAVGTVTPPDTGTGGLADQDGGFLSLWTLVALAIGGTVLVAGGMVTRRAAK